MNHSVSGPQTHRLDNDHQVAWPSQRPMRQNPRLTRIQSPTSRTGAAERRPWAVGSREDTIAAAKTVLQGLEEDSELNSMP